MEVVFALLALGLVGLAMVGSLVGLFAWTRTSRLEKRIDELARELEYVRRSRGAPPVETGAPAAEPTPRVAVAPDPRPAAAAPVIMPPSPPLPAAPIPVPRDIPLWPGSTPGAIPSRPRMLGRVLDEIGIPAADAPRPGRAAPPPIDFATNLGPKILVATGALAFMVFLGLFVKYAWDNNWVGPAGRVLIGALFGLGLLALGMRLMRREYRPLGQGLAAAGLAGLYISAFAAHGFYNLVPREVSALLMVAVTASAVLLAVRLDARLLAALAWTGGYMTPLLLSTGEDRALALFLFIALLDAGALLIDHRKPWPETAPIAMTGTVLLYSGWYARFFRPERFEVAALGLVLFTVLFAFGMARKQRGSGLTVVVALGGVGVSVLAGGADRPLPLLVLSLVLGAGALRASRTMGRPLAAAALLAAGLPYVVWWLSHYRPETFGIAALWVLVVAALFILPVPGDEAEAGPAGGSVSRAAVGKEGPGLELAVLAGAGIASAALCAGTDRPLEIAGFLAAMAGLAVLLRVRWREAEVLGILAAALSIALWMAKFFTAARAGDAYLVALPAAGVFTAALLVRGLLARQHLGGSDIVAHLLLAAFTWWFFYSVLDATHPALKGPAAAAIAAGYLAVGLAALRQSDRDPRLVRVALGLATVFLTLAIPIQLGLHGVTLGWAAEGVVLLALGTRFASAQARAGAYAVLFLAVVRLVAMNQPLHEGAFRPVFNPVFGTWLVVVAALGVAMWVARAPRRELHPLDATVGPFLGGLAILLLFGVLNGETRATFAQRRLEADRLGDIAASQAARRVGGLAVSVLWTIFATGLLAAGLAARSRALFYAAYGLFALTAGKVVLWDLEDFSVPYRMAAFLALGVLLMAGAYLNLRFRQRLLPPPAQ